MPKNKKGEEGSKKKVIVKYVAIAVSAGIGCFVLARISRPILLSLAHYIISLEKGSDGGYQAMEIAVETEEVKSVVMPKYVNTIGELKADKSVVIHSEINGKIDSISFSEGTNVAKGALLIKFDDKQAQAELRLRRAKLEMAKIEYLRYKKMRESDAGSEKEMDKATAEFNMATAEVEAAEANLQKTEVRAPFDGTIGLIDVGIGAYVQPNQDLVTLVDQNSVKVKFGVSGKYVNDVGVGQAVELRVESCKNRVFNGIVEAVDSHVDSSTNNISLRAAVSNEDGALKAGLFSDVMLVIGEQGETITVDEAAIERIGEQEFVWIVDRKKARRLGILTGARYRGRVEVIAGLKPGQIVVVAGQLRLYEGAWVRAINADANVDSDGAAIDELVEGMM
jgi:membrane fusion protein (multidrug efflux system)